MTLTVSEKVIGFQNNSVLQREHIGNKKFWKYLSLCAVTVKICISTFKKKPYVCTLSCKEKVLDIYAICSKSRFFLQELLTLREI